MLQPDLPCALQHHHAGSGCPHPGCRCRKAGRAAAGAQHLRAALRRAGAFIETTPMAYLRRVRLDHARAESRAVPGQTTVTRVAARWGYTRPSAFTAHYRAAYEELPSQTLHGDFRSAAAAES
ncbi:helix-turn-helix domain-containing protein [Amycolatopsis sp. NPDC004079]|uniref:helix-turn-helix domain-containing protein n=1 Tax=Amycolatopsis sp. NPDC004079 TaxID=3154549 RepID=UPI0033B03F13